MGAIGIFTSITTSEVKFESLKVPSPFVDLGYSSEITTTRILDEIARINALSTSTKDIKNFGNKQPGDQLSNLQSLPLPGLSGIDINAIQELVQGLLGVKKERITGEITYTKQLDRINYHVRIRQMPENKMLVNFQFSTYYGGFVQSTFKVNKKEIIVLNHSESLNNVQEIYI